jgi:hypothetical protein
MRLSATRFFFLGHNFLILLLIMFLPTLMILEEEQDIAVTLLAFQIQQALSCGLGVCFLLEH